MFAMIINIANDLKDKRYKFKIKFSQNFFAKVVYIVIARMNNYASKHLRNTLALYINRYIG